MPENHAPTFSDNSERAQKGHRRMRTIWKGKLPNHIAQLLIYNARRRRIKELQRTCQQTNEVTSKNAKGKDTCHD